MHEPNAHQGAKQVASKSGSFSVREATAPSTGSYFAPDRDIGSGHAADLNAPPLNGPRHRPHGPKRALKRSFPHRVDVPLPGSGLGDCGHVGLVR